MRGGKAYDQWFKAWKKKGSPKWPEFMAMVLVRWTDAASHSDSDVRVVKAVAGWCLVDATEDAIKVAMEAFEDQDTREHMAIPARMIDEVIEVGIVKAFPK